jgi:hypothetical protein
MKTLLVAASLATASGLAAAQAQMPTPAPTADVPRHNCGAPPKLPSRLMLSDKMIARSFEADLKSYKECFNTYVAQRTASMKAHQEAANAAVNEYNEQMRELNAAGGAKSSETPPENKKTY